MLTVSILFCLAIAIMCLVAGSHGFVNTYFGCNGKFNGVMEVWQGIDAYLQRVDQSLCSPECPCIINNKIPFETNATVSPYYKNWNTTENTLGAISFQNCSIQVQENTKSLAEKDDVLFNPKKDFDSNLFARYMGNIEQNFNCAGWCNVTYANPTVRKSTTMYKYLFSDINK